MKIYDGTDVILGRLAAKVAKDALLGEEVVVVNCEKIVISGRKEKVFANEKKKRDRKGYPLKSAKFSRLPERMVRRTIRGMLPWKQTRGKEAFKRIMTFRGVPDKMANEKMVKLDKDSRVKLPTLYYTTVGDVCKHLRGQG